MRQEETKTEDRKQNPCDRHSNDQKYYVGELITPVSGVDEESLQKAFGVYAALYQGRISVQLEPSRRGRKWLHTTFHLTSRSTHPTTKDMHESLAKYFGTKVEIRELSPLGADQAILEEICLQQGLGGGGGQSATPLLLSPVVTLSDELTDIKDLEKYAFNEDFCKKLDEWIRLSSLANITNPRIGFLIVAEYEIDIRPWLWVLVENLYRMKFIDAPRYVQGLGVSGWRGNGSYLLPEYSDNRKADPLSGSGEDKKAEVKNFRTNNSPVRIAAVTPAQYKKLSEQQGFAGYIFKDAFPVVLKIANITSELSDDYQRFCELTGMAPSEVLTARRLVKRGSVESVAETQSEPWEELDGLIGLEPVKQQVREIAAFVKAHGRENLPSLHMVFRGNPGTAKTTVARIIAKIFDKAGVNKKRGVFIEADRSKLIAEYVGHTALKTNALIEKAEGGVLFIDEAYSLDPGGFFSGDPFAKEAIATLVKGLEDKREDFICIMAGYPKEMDRMIAVNPGMQSRIAFYLDFPDYSAGECGQIFCKIAQDSNYQVEDEATTEVIKYFEKTISCGDEAFANGRAARKLFERVQFKQAMRMQKEDDVDGSDQIVTRSDVLEALACPEFQVIEATTETRVPFVFAGNPVGFMA